MNSEQTVERDEFVVKTLQQAYKEIEYLQRLMRREITSATCTLLMISMAEQIMGEE